MKKMKYQFKTNINCGGCINTVAGILDKLEGLRIWHVNTNLPDKILTVDLDGIEPEIIIKSVTEAGYKITLVS